MLSAIEQRWVSELARFNFEVKFRPGRLNGSADGLSRRPMSPGETYHDMDQEEVANALGVTLILVDLRHKFQKAAVCGNVKADVQERPDTRIFQRLTYQELLQMQQEDPVLGVLWTYMDKRQKPSHKERAIVTSRSEKVYSRLGPFEDV